MCSLVKLTFPGRLVGPPEILPRPLTMSEFTFQLCSLITKVDSINARVVLSFLSLKVILIDDFPIGGNALRALTPLPPPRSFKISPIELIKHYYPQVHIRLIIFGRVAFPAPAEIPKNP